MNKDKIILTIACITIFSANVFTIKDAIKTIEGQKVEISEMKTEIEESNNKINEVVTENESLKTKVSDLEKDVIAKSEELEVARRNIEQVNKITTFTYSDVTQPSGATIVHMKRALKGTKLIDVANAFVDAEKQYGINAYFLAAICAQESGWGSSNRAQNQNNLTGHAVYSSASRGSTFSSRYQNIMSTAKLLKDDYLTPSGWRYHGVSVEGVNEGYCFLEDGKTVDYGWTRNVASISYQLKNSANEFN